MNDDTSGMIAVALIGLIVLFALGFFGVGPLAHIPSSYTEAEMKEIKEEAYHKGYDEGYKDGKSEGYDEGYEEEHEDVWQDGYDTGFNQGYDQCIEDAEKAEKESR